MSTTLWVISGILAFAMVMAGAMKLMKGQAGIVEKMPWAEDYSDAQVRMLGAAELLGGIGLIVPVVTGIMPILAPIAAACLTVLMLGAVYTHVKRKEMFVPPLVLAGMGGYLAYVGLVAA